MSGQFPKTVGTICLSILLLYSGVAWALQNCLGAGKAIGHARADHDESAAISNGASPSLAPFLHSNHRLVERVHCLDSHHRIGPMGQPSSVFRLAPSDEGTALKFSLLTRSASSRETKASWLSALFERFLQSSSPPGLSRYLLLSVLRI